MAMTFEEAKKKAAELLPLAKKLEDAVEELRTHLPDSDEEYDPEEWGDLPHWMAEASEGALNAWQSLTAAATATPGQGFGDDEE